MNILEMSAGGGVLIAAILAVRRYLLHRVPKWTFLLLWGAALCRLLIPAALPSPISVYTGAAWVGEMIRPAETEQTPVLSPAPNAPTDWEDHPFDAPEHLWEESWTLPAVVSEQEMEARVISPIAAVYWTGAALSVLFFTAAYLWALRRFWDAVPAEDDFLLRWQREHPTLFPVQIRVSQAVSAPMAYGLLRPVILLPEDTDWSDQNQLSCILTHEYVHIRRGDLFWKLLLTAALCIHWFNPLVWAMYFLANRDLELACDERVIRILGLENRRNYAYALLAAAESKFSPFCITYTTKNHMEERIRAIMKMKKKSVAAILTAVMLVTGVTAVFATSRAPESERMEKLPQAVVSDGVPQPAPAPVEGQPQGDSPAAVPSEAGLLWPLPQEYREISYPFTERTVHPVTGEVKDHPGIDIAAPKGTSVYAAKSGTVTRSELDSTYGSLVELSHSDSTSTLYAHLDRRDVEVGQTVKQGETIGAVGATGKATGPVLHFAILMDGSPVDPAMQFEPSVRPAADNAPAARNDSSELQTSTSQEPAPAALENRWGVPEGEIPQWTEFTVDSFEDGDKLGKYLEAAHSLYPGDYVSGRINGTRYIVQITYMEREIRERLPDGVYPVNTKGETYGTAMDNIVVGYDPDLVLVVATNGKEGYAVKDDLSFGGYPGEVNNPDDALAYMEWLKTQPETILIPVYDANHDSVIGYFGLSNGGSGITPEEELKMVEDQMRRNMGLSEEEIARELEALKQSRRWN
ncbi:M23/M56 family metallopeptidase [Flintibacter muris]|uniref:M23/M56 family metallopeptidase n=1 Tax=Flintibacter muris TaxID=2941327 RepID=UPI00203A7F6F|nr:M23/M56 family metallopeptidase [Flintibacter muris]